MSLWRYTLQKYCCNNFQFSEKGIAICQNISTVYSPTVFDGDNEGVLFCTDGDRDVISSLGEHNITQSSSAIKACPSLHSYFPSTHAHRMLILINTQKVIVFRRHDILTKTAFKIDVIYL